MKKKKLLKEIAGMLKTQSEAIDQRFEQIDQRFEKVDQRFEQIDQKLEKVDQRFGQIDQKLEKVDQRFEEQEKSFNQKLEEQSRELKIYMENNIESRINALFDGYHLVSEKQDRLEKETASLRNEMDKTRIEVTVLKNQMS